MTRNQRLRRWLIAQQVILAASLIFNGCLMWWLLQSSADVHALLHGAKHLYDFAADRCLQGA